MSTLTREQVLAMEAGAELDGLEEQHVMRRERPRLKAIYNHATGCWEPQYLTAYSTDIAAAWEVVEEMTRQGRFVEVGSVRGGWYCDVVMGTPWPIAAPTPALAICRAALLTTLTEAE